MTDKEQALYERLHYMQEKLLAYQIAVNDFLNDPNRTVWMDRYIDRFQDLGEENWWDTDPRWTL